MKKMSPIFILLIVVALISCTTSSPNAESLAASKTSEATFVSNTSTTTNSPPETAQTFEKLPPLAQYINELKRYEGGEVNNGNLVEPNTILVLDNEEVIFPEQEDDYSYYHQLKYFNTKSAQFKGGWEGTSGIYAWTSSYRLLNEDKNEPLVLAILQSKFSGRDFEGYMMEQEELRETLNKAGIEDNEDIALAMQERNWTGIKKSLDEQTDDHSIGFIVWQKKEGIWQDVSSKYISLETITQFEQHFPFFKLKEGEQYGYRLNEQLYTEYCHKANKVHAKNWFGSDDLATRLTLTLEQDDILLNISKDKSIRWKWDGQHYTLLQLPDKVDFITTSCDQVNWGKGGSYSFKGNIGDNPIQMKVKFVPNATNVELEGEYWYTKKPSSKFPIKGNISNNNDAEMIFHRMKGDEKRERFDFYFYNCKLEGWWQHLGSMQIYKFSLDLIE